MSDRKPAGESKPEYDDVDPTRLAEWMGDHLGLDVTAHDLTLVRFRGGHSNRTYGVTSPAGRWVLRLPPTGAVAKGAHDVSRECRVLEAVAPEFPLAPRVVATEDDPAVLGAPFYLMEHIEGTILRKDFPADMKPTEDTRREYASALIRALALLHQTATDSPALRAIGNPVGYTERQLSGWAKRFDDSATRPLPKATQALAWLTAHLPREDADCVIHNDWKFDNVVFEGASTRLIGVLDWELATRGHPLMDLGTVLAAWVEVSDPVPVQLMRLGPTNLPGMPTRAELAALYGTLSGRDTAAWRAFHVFGLVKLGVVAQQLYARFLRGEARDPRFAALEYAIPALFDFCEKHIHLAETA
ncbi:MAG: phosphotransferase family protein [Sandaracinaceae bacterium]|jgi:aminoglycoside phosphotransferase (APT) family kinase protein|nr:phosphotransferase family protein [Sandaracinaceae bacterium]